MPPDDTAAIVVPLDAPTEGMDVDTAIAVGMELGALSEQAAQTEEVAEETAQDVEALEERTSIEWQSLNARMAQLETQVIQMESRLSAQQVETQEVVEAAIEAIEEAAQETEEMETDTAPELELQLVEPTQGQETQGNSIFGTATQKRKRLRLF